MCAVALSLILRPLPLGLLEQSPPRRRWHEADLKLCEARHAPAHPVRHMVAAQQQWQGACPEHHMSDDAKLGLILLFMVFALMVIGPVIAG